ncbi:AraC family transcriptional regulator [Hoeflea alexandrii]|uniref:Helix-turn-helix domain-containing protein n=1 Tax=Hoeflea alexandrii TaxID=288436 RepID=A0ABT1CUY0_9HYPH|nr:AraC family transcriptional regulator [Hoeflea alexandrii]MCO6409161.1 helix-turn-helix domain-containing protein [Hoeflea alexandrii]MCY0151767.1 AraC family transcriptional regulator [Hoeflea alexandrii]
MRATQQSYRDRLDRVTAYLHANVESDIDIVSLSNVACLSSYHWHRIYTAMVGETVAATLRRLRLQRAADRLANSDMKISDISKLAQYRSQDAFSRAFRDAYGKTPGAYRLSGSHAAFKAAIANANAKGFHVSIEHHDAVRCVSVPHIGSYLRIDAAMTRLFSILTKAQMLAQNAPMQAVFYDDPDLRPEETLRSAACTPWSEGLEIPKGTEELLRPAGRYAKLRYKGPYANMRGAYHWLYGVWLPGSGFEISERPGFEAYLNSPVDTKPEDLRSDIFLPIDDQQ